MELPPIESWEELRQVLPAFLIRTGVAAICGAVIGLERELNRKPAGFRTNILICTGAAMYMLVGTLIVGQATGSSDPARIAAQVVTGIGFLGAGCIIQAGRRVTGLTSAATIWVVAAIGIIAGAGYPIVASIAAMMVVAALAILGEVETRWLRPFTERRQRSERDE